jgi:crotonobetainyl-CoA:carnitine CoA-transferase CaiB-like acyl-CoA transferase
MLDSAGIPSGKVRGIDETYEWEQTRSQGLLVEVDHATLGRISLPGSPLRFDGGGRIKHAPPPTLGQHDESVRAWLDEVEPEDPGR